MTGFVYDPFDPAVMADPLPYYRVLRDHHPVYYLPQVGHLRALAVRRHLGCAGGQRRNLRRLGRNASARDRAGPSQRRTRSTIRRCIPLPFHAVFRRADLRRRAQGAQPAVPAQAGRGLGSTGSASWPTNGSTSCCRGGHSTSPRTTAESSSPRWFANYWASQSNSLPTCWPRSMRAAWPNPAAASTPRRPGRTTSNTSSPPSGGDGPIAADGELPVVDGLLGYRLPDSTRARRRRSRHPDAVRVHRRNRNGAQGRRARLVGAAQASRPTDRGARRPGRQRGETHARR